MSYKKRIQKIQTDLKSNQLDALFVSNPDNVYYLSGYQVEHYSGTQPIDDPEAFLLVTPDNCFILVDARNEGSVKNLKDVDFVELADKPRDENLSKQLEALVTGTKVAFEFDSLNYADLSGLESNMTTLEIKDGSALIKSARLVKDKAELELLQKAAEITSSGFEFALEQLKKGVTEKQLAKMITGFFIENAEGNSFSPIVAFNEGSAIPHYKPSDKKIEGEGILLIDLGCVNEGYCGDMTRMVYLGEPTDEYVEKYNLVLEAQQAALYKLTVGTPTIDIDNAVRAVFSKNNVEDLFKHGTGHGLGLEIHENPYLNTVSEETLKAGMVFSVEPGLYIEGWGGIRIEDIVFMDDNEIVNLTKTSKKILSIEI